VKGLSILTGDCREILPTLEAGSVQCCVTSPPYWGLRDYGTAQWEGGEMLYKCDQCGASRRSGVSSLREEIPNSIRCECGGNLRKYGCDHKFDHSKREAKARNFVNGEGRLTTACSSWTTRSESEFHRDCPKCGARRIDSQLGLEATPEEYIANMVAVFREVKRVLKDDGTLWVNMGDSYAGSSNGDNKSGLAKFSELYDGNKRYPENHANFRGDMHGFERPKAVKAGLKPKDLCMMPARLAMALQADGWYLRSEIVWHKPNPMPESVTDRPTKAHEMIYLLTKAERYFYDAEAIREPNTLPIRNPGGHCPEKAIGPQNRNGHSQWDKFRTAEDAYNAAGRNKRSVWTIATQPYAEAHFATFPEEIPKLCILAGSRVGDTVLDPFAGSGTTGKVAIELGRKAILIELNPEYMRLARARTFVTPGFF
jgi:DNA modification methylase